MEGYVDEQGVDDQQYGYHEKRPTQPGERTWQRESRRGTEKLPTGISPDQNRPHTSDLLNVLPVSDRSQIEEPSNDDGHSAQGYVSHACSI